MRESVKNFIKLLNENGIDAFITNKPFTRQLFTGYRGISSKMDGQVLVDNTGVKLFVSRMNYEHAVAEADDKESITIVKYESDYMASLGQLFVDKGYKKMAFEENFLSVKELAGLKSKLPNTEFVYGTELINKCKQKKTQEDLIQYRKVCTITDEIWKRVLPVIKVGVTEKEVEAKILISMMELGADTTSFLPIVVSGARSSMPHGRPSEKRLENGDFVTVDMGFVLNGYTSDFTRTVVIGKASEKHRQIYDAVLRAQEAALKGIKAGMTGKAGDEIARNIIDEAGYGEYFNHGLGHGFDDGVFLSKSGKDFILEENMVFTIEPGIYIEGFGGVRIEDTVILSKDGCVSLFKSGKELIQIV
ncbi:MAG: Xaa-Pro peptidase family protein [Treponema sp.]|nr:Xaa-Pro peptidase family protein [Treponema sp.]